MLKLWKKRLLVQIIGSFSVLSITIVALVAYIASQQARNSLKASVFQKLTAVAVLKENELNRWLTDRRDSLLALAELTAVNNQATTLLTTKPSDPTHQAAADYLHTTLQGFINRRTGFQEVFVLSHSSRILMSTNKKNVGLFIEHSEITLISQSLASTANFYRSSETGTTTVTFATPILDDTGDFLGTLAVHLNLDRLDSIIRNNQGLEGAGESYLVADLGNSYSFRNVFVSAAGFGSDEFPDGIESPGIRTAMAGNNGTGLYRNYRDVPVIGVYRWLEQQNVAFLVELEQQEAFALARQLAIRIVLVGLSSAALLMVGIVLLGQQILKPIRAIADTAHSVEAKVKLGDISGLQTAPVLTENEIGLLAETFNQMIRQLQQSYRRLADYSHTLEEKVVARTQEIEAKNQDLQTALGNVAQRTDELAAANAKITQLNERLQVENLRMGAELDVAQRIQTTILPRPEELAVVPSLDISGYMNPADEVGGDYYDVLVEAGVVTIGIGDVTGHGLESGLVMVMAQTAIRILKEAQESDPVRFLNTVNAALYKNVERMGANRNMTLAILNYAEGNLSISGQHEEVLVVRAKGELERVNTLDLGITVGLMDDIAEFIAQTHVALQPGDGVVLYTDGIPEAKSEAGQFYGLERLCTVVQQHWSESAQTIQERAIADFQAFVGNAKVMDDVTLLVLKRRLGDVENLEK